MTEGAPTKRSLEVRSLLDQGKSVEDISKALGLTVNTVRHYGSYAKVFNEKKPLTPRESQIAEMIRRGMPTPEIAATLQLSVRTVDGHRSKLMAKLKARNMSHLAAVLNDEALAALRSRVELLEQALASLTNQLAELRKPG